MSGLDYSSADVAELYAALWSYGYQNGFGQSEGLYRTVLDLACRSYPSDAAISILDVGCGVGRTAGDLAARFPRATVIGVDAAPAMIDVAARLNTARFGSRVVVDATGHGLGLLALTPRPLTNLRFETVDVMEFLAGSDTYDLITVVNVLDRTPDANRFLDRLSGALASGGRVVLSSPLNYQRASQWRSLGKPASVLERLERLGVRIEEHFDGLPYDELMDARGAVQSFKTLVVSGVRE